MFRSRSNERSKQNQAPIYIITPHLPATTHVFVAVAWPPSHHARLQETTLQRRTPVIERARRHRRSMAVEAHHLLPVREVAHNAIVREQGYDNYCMSFVSPSYTPFCVPMPAAAAESDVTFANTVAAPQGLASRKRARAEGQSVGVAAHAKRPVLDIDHAVLQHVEEMSVELERRRLYARQVVAAARAAVARRLVAKDEEVDRVRRLNWALEERLRGVCAEAQAWRDLALSHEAVAAALRADLDHELQARAEAQARLADDDPGDAGSCCYGDNKEEEWNEENAATTSGGSCRGCGERAAVVLVLPCRHLCACAACAAAAWACPACGCAKSGDVSVNLA